MRIPTNTTIRLLYRSLSSAELKPGVLPVLELELGGAEDELDEAGGGDWDNEDDEEEVEEVDEVDAVLALELELELDTEAGKDIDIDDDGVPGPIGSGRPGASLMVDVA